VFSKVVVCITFGLYNINEKTKYNGEMSESNFGKLWVLWILMIHVANLMLAFHKSDNLGLKYIQAMHNS
jgi:hypothetical protein